ncbi:MAG: TetR/AcrR family transcriptional regulator [Chloroflexi bacterium]|nr:TetR/AcrR family transcriptional regulator [Chloroflexota bacterium]
MTSPRRTESEPVRREQILSAARKVLADKGYDNVKVSDIAAEAGIAQGTFYLYFASKKSVVIALGRRMMELVAPRLARTYDPAATFHESLPRYIEVMFQTASENADLCRIMSVGEESNHEELEAEMLAEGHPIAAHMYRMFHQGIERGEIDGVDIEIAMKLMMGMLKTGIQEANCFGQPGTGDRIKETLTRMLINAFPKK